MIVIHSCMRENGSKFTHNFQINCPNHVDINSKENYQLKLSMQNNSKIKFEKMK